MMNTKHQEGEKKEILNLHPREQCLEKMQIKLLFVKKKKSPFFALPSPTKAFANSLCLKIRISTNYEQFRNFEPPILML